MSWVPTAAAVFFVGLAVSSVMPLRGWMGLFAEVLIVTTIYVALCWGITLNEGEKEQLMFAIKRYRG